MDPWLTWFFGVMARIGAPASAANADTMWAWSHRETDPFPVMHNNNPLNTTWWMPGALPWNTIGTLHVWIFATVQDGIEATAATLLQQGVYPTIVGHLRNSIPRSQWGDCCAQLGKWGTGCDWLTRAYSAAPGNLPSMGGGDIEMAKLVAGDSGNGDPHGKGAVYRSDGMAKEYISDPGALPGFEAWLGAVQIVSQGSLNEVRENVVAFTLSAADEQLLREAHDTVATLIKSGALTPAEAQQLQEAHDKVLALSVTGSLTLVQDANLQAARDAITRIEVALKGA